MRVAFVTTNLKGGGAERAVLSTAKGLAARGHAVHVVLVENLLEHALPPEVTLHALTVAGRPAGKGWLGKRASAWQLRRLFRQLRAGAEFDLVVSTLPHCDEVVALAGLNRVWFRIANTLSAEIGLLRKTSARKAERRLHRYRRLYDGANVLAVSDGVALDLSGTLGMKRANVVRIYNAIDAAAIRDLAAMPEPALPREPYLIHVGRFVPQKRHDLLFEALRHSQLPHRLVLLTHPAPALERLIRTHGLAQRVTVAGFQRNPYPWIACAELLVLCSDHEGMPNVLVEALACQTRVASTDCPSGPREVLEGELARHLVPCGDAEALARAMRAALSAPRPRAAASLKRFAPETVLAQYESLPGLWRSD